MGCSQLEAIFDHLCQGKESRGLAQSAARQEQCQTTSTLMVMVIAAGKWAKHFPSFHRAPLALAAIPRAVRPTAVVTNFAAAHLLHVHPVRPLFDADSAMLAPKCYPQSTCADYRGIQLFATGEWPTVDAMAYRHALGPSTRVVFMTPNWICDAKLYQQYRRQLATPAPRRDAKCLDWISRRAGPPPADSGRRVCEHYTFTSAGTFTLAVMINAFAQRANASLLRAHVVTRDRCNDTMDARHYPPLVPAQVDDLVGALR